MTKEQLKAIVKRINKGKENLYSCTSVFAYVDSDEVVISPTEYNDGSTFYHIGLLAAIETAYNCHSYITINYKDGQHIIVGHIY